MDGEESKVKMDASVTSLTEIGAMLRATLTALIPPHSRVALINFPDHGNVGDTAIWLGENAVLRSLGIHVVYRASWRTADPEIARRRLGQGIILLQGGGNLGDVYAGQAGTRARFLKECSDIRTIQLPQSIWFQDSANIAPMKVLFENHKNFTLLVRENRSLEFARRHFAVDTRFCPDFAFGLGAIRCLQPPAEDILALKRQDRERLSETEEFSGQGIRTTDWPGFTGTEAEFEKDLPTRWAFRFRDRFAMRPMPNLEVHPLFNTLLGLSFQQMSRYYLNQARTQFSNAHIIITDRLHGHIIALLLGKISIALDTVNSKIRSTYETYTHGLPGSYFATDPSEAIRLARRLMLEAQ